MSIQSGVKRIYLLDYGWISCERGWCLPDPCAYSEKNIAKTSQWVEVPVSGALIEHEQGLVLVDTGSHPEASKVWPEATWEAFPMTKFEEENRLENQIARAGYSPEDVTHVLFTHLHLDHAGQAGLLREKKATFIAHHQELLYALYLIWIGKPGAYLPGDLEALKGANWFTFKETEYEILPGIKMIWVGGHTPGSCLVKITTEKGNTYFLTGDLVHLPEELDLETKGWLLGDAEEFLHAARKLKMFAKMPNTHLVIGHDPDLWNKFPKNPDFLI